ncbi:MAG: hypothetical protein ACPGVD_06400 [Flavobacteriales bacterium]
MKSFFYILPIFILITNCSPKYRCDDIEFKDGFMFEKNSNILATGLYRCFEPKDGIYGSQLNIIEYKDGLGTDKWEYYYNDDLIQFGEFIENRELKNLIISLVKPEGIEIQTFYEGSKETFGWLYIDIIKPKKSLNSKSIKSIKHQARKLSEEYQITGYIIKEWKNNEWKQY